MSEGYRVSQGARDDLDAIWLYGAETYSLDRADAYDRDLHAAFERLVPFPYLGVDVPEREDGMRTLVHASHITAYQPDTEAVLIVRVLIQRTDWMALIAGE